MTSITEVYYTNINTVQQWSKNYLKCKQLFNYSYMSTWKVEFISSVDKRVHHSRVSVFHLKFRLLRLVSVLNALFLSGLSVTHAAWVTGKSLKAPPMSRSPWKSWPAVRQPPFLYDITSKWLKRITLWSNSLHNVVFWVLLGIITHRISPTNEILGFNMLFSRFLV